MSTETNSIQACRGFQCLVAQPENPEQAGWRDGYCPECLDELARDEIRAERQDARNESDTPETDSAAWFEDYGNPCGPIEVVTAKLSRHIELRLAEAERQRDALAEALKRTASDFIAFRSIARENGIVGTLGLESLELASTALSTLNLKPE